MIEKAAIVNADDFGFAPNVTEGIVRAHLNGIVTSTTLMANMPGAEAAVGRLGEAPELGVGVHLNASQGRPLSREGLALADEDGVMRHTAVGLIAACCVRPWLVRAIAAEFEAQIRWVLDHGVRPTHLDSHRHTHGFPPVFRRVVALARRYNVPFVRRHRERIGRMPTPLKAGETLTFPKAGKMPAPPPRQRWTSCGLNVLGVVNGWMAGGICPTNGTWGVAHTGMLDSAWFVWAAEQMEAGITEIMVHPGRREETGSGAGAGIVDAAAYSRLSASRERELAALCDPNVREAFERNGVRLIHYGRLPIVGSQLSVGRGG
jgi:predicted glycoside hydrolase/deacetylase ChbG (UPF0249 family)